MAIAKSLGVDLLGLNKSKPGQSSQREIRPMQPTTDILDKMGDLAIARPGVDTQAQSRAIVERMKAEQR